MTEQEVIFEEIGKSEHAKIFKQIFIWNNWRFSIYIKADSIASQSYARISVWANFQWNFIIDIHYSKMTTKYESVFCSADNSMLFADDRERLFEVASEIVYE